MATVTKIWTITASWPRLGDDCDFYTYLESQGQTTGGQGYKNITSDILLSVNNNDVSGVFKLSWGGDTTTYDTKEIWHVYYQGEVPTGRVELGKIFVHANWFSESSSSITVSSTNGQSFGFSPARNYGECATASDPYVVITLYSDDGGSGNYITVTFDPTDNAPAGVSVIPPSILYVDPTSQTTYSAFPSLKTDQFATKHFVGWFTAKTGGRQKYTSDTLISLADHTLYAQWEDSSTGYNSCTVTFWGLTGPWTSTSAQARYSWETTSTRPNYLSYDSIIYTPGEINPQTLEPSTIIPKYTFRGWSRYQDTYEAVVVSSGLISSQSHTLYAFWDRTGYEYKFWALFNSPFSSQAYKYWLAQYSLAHFLLNGSDVPSNEYAQDFSLPSTTVTLGKSAPAAPGFAHWVLPSTGAGFFHLLPSESRLSKNITGSVSNVPNTIPDLSSNTSLPLLDTSSEPYETDIYFTERAITYDLHLRAVQALPSTEITVDYVYGTVNSNGLVAPVPSGESYTGSEGGGHDEVMEQEFDSWSAQLYYNTILKLEAPQEIIDEQGKVIRRFIMWRSSLGQRWTQNKIELTFAPDNPSSGALSVDVVFTAVYGTGLLIRQSNNTRLLHGNKYIMLLHDM